MACERADTLVHGYFDNELDALRAAEFESHLEQCSECVAALDALESLRSTINVAQPYEKMPASFRKKILADLHVKSPTVMVPTRATANWRWLAMAAAFLLLIYGGWRVASLNTRGDGREALMASRIVDAHLRSLQPGHLADVISTDQHTVKPWFEGKVDFAPPVRDFTEQGFPLQGGRLDVVDNRTVAALVYGRRKHVVNVFVWPTSEKDAAPRTGSIQGYQWIDWRKQGMEFYAVSDAAAPDLHQLQRLFSN
jgi:anti-sigma factor RsiW